MTASWMMALCGENSVLKEEMKVLSEEYDSMRARLGITEEMKQSNQVAPVITVTFPLWFSLV